MYVKDKGMIMKSIKTKLLAMMILCILTSVLINSVVSINNSNKVINEDSVEVMNLHCSNTAQNINALLSRIDQSVTTLSSSLLTELDDIHRFQTDPQYVQEFSDKIDATVLNAAIHTEGALTAYVRYNPEFTDPTSGVFYSRSSASSGFEQVVPTDFSMYDPSDSAHVGWYYIPVQNGKPTWMSPYVNENIGVHMISYVIPLTVDGVSVGIVGMDIEFSQITDIVDQAQFYGQGYAFLTDDTNQIIYHPELEMYTDLSTINDGEMKALSDYLSQGDKGEDLYSYTYQGLEKQMVYTTLNDGLKLLLTAPSKDIHANATKLMFQMLAISAVAVLVTVGLSLFVIQRMVKPIRELSDAAERVGNGDLSVVISHHAKDEIGTLALNFGKAVKQLQEYIDYIDEVSAVLDDMANGNFSFQLKYAYVGEFARIKAALEKVSRLLGNTISQIHKVSGFVAVSSEHLSSSANELSQGTEEQASSVGELSNTISIITKQMEENAQNAQEASQLSEEAGMDITSSNEKMREMMKAMGEISNMSSEIEKIIKTIDDIAMQTNILALNAAVEAARAGEAGKGFAVVADEVRNLAQKSAEAVKNTTVLVEETIHAVENGTVIADDTAKAMEETVGKVKNVNAKIIEIASATEEQEGSVEQVKAGVQKIDAVVQLNSAAAEESAATSMELNGHAQSLNELIKKFQLGEVDRKGYEEANDASNDDL